MDGLTHWIFSQVSFHLILYRHWSTRLHFSLKKSIIFKQQLFHKKKKIEMFSKLFFCLLSTNPAKCCHPRLDWLDWSARILSGTEESENIKSANYLIIGCPGGSRGSPLPSWLGNMAGQSWQIQVPGHLNFVCCCCGCCLPPSGQAAGCWRAVGVWKKRWNTCSRRRTCQAGWGQRGDRTPDQWCLQRPSLQFCLVRKFWIEKQSRYYHPRLKEHLFWVVGLVLLLQLLL